MFMRFAAAMMIAPLTIAPAIAADLTDTHVRVEAPGAKGIAPVYRPMRKSETAARVAHHTPAGKIKPVANPGQAAGTAEAPTDND
ncbi:hypothetical protein [Sphingomonas sp. ID0503]|uniref:hypothetical protein n=1 Tax=Sphingomonas sp. ID0503 TaxID=3399691 RepID=UPI003AFA3659